MPAPIIMVHGAFCGGWVFDRFRTPFEASGHAVLTPDLRGHGRAERRDAVVGVSMRHYASDVAKLCAEVGEPPILVGHSMGGLVAQMAAARVRVAGLVLLAPSPPWGGPASSMEEAVAAFGLHLLGPYWAQTVNPDKALSFNYCLDRMSPAERAATHARMVPESGRAIFETLNWWLDPFMTTSVAPGSLKAPVLALVGDRDVIHPPATVKMNAQRLGARFVRCAGMSHWLPEEPGWEMVARSALDWIAELVSAPA